MQENVILGALLNNEQYMRKVAPFIKGEYFQSQQSRHLFDMIVSFVNRYNKLPTKKILEIEVDKANLSEQMHKHVTETIAGIDTAYYDPEISVDWLVDQTEKFCQDRAIFLAVQKSITILEDEKSEQTKESIPGILQDALGVAFDSNIGHDFFEDVEERYKFYHSQESRIPFDIDVFNFVTNGGLARKSLTILMAGTGVGKTLGMCDMAASAIRNGYNVLYITMEMAEERIAERIDANLLDIAVDKLVELPYDVFKVKSKRVKENTPGKLIIREYPTATAGASHFRHLLNELRIKKNFKPDIVFIDYLNICISSRYKSGSNVGSYFLIKAIAEELRGLGVEFDVPIVSATQTTREGFSSSDLDLDDVSESFGLAHTADFMFAIVSNDELAKMNQLMIKILKNRWADVNKVRKFFIGVDRSKMRWYALDDNMSTGAGEAPLNIPDKTDQQSKSYWEKFTT